ncbi:hypothetical protein GHK86_04560 [Acidimicrobiaceae bacterium USS-CC1]|uniref:Uncharacterized protein n=1 Tax=Acidiferrimicrobium australe TaxID=2664430 RepID=A0ABW9QQA5_9ACTN|nr:hypothetical protein [Acidiferrimicrobium australe]
MAMSLEEMELETVEFVPAREVMCTVWYQPPTHCDGGQGQGGYGNGGWSGGGGHETTTTFTQNSQGTYCANGGQGFSILSGNNVLDGNNVSIGL